MVINVFQLFTMVINTLHYLSLFFNVYQLLSMFDNNLHIFSIVYISFQLISNMYLQMQNE